MTLVSAIIQQGFRDANLIPIGSSPTTNESDEALKRLQVIISSTLGNEAGEILQPFQVGTNGVNASWIVPSVPTWLPINVRLVCNLSSAQTLYLNPQPQDGSRIGVIDTSGNFATNNLILNANGRLIESAASVTLSANSLAREWFYRADLGNWARVTDLATSDEMPFPQEFDDLFIVSLAMRLNPRNAQQTSQESVNMMDRSRAQFRARYSQTIPTAADIGVLRPNWIGPGNINNGWVF